MSGTLTGTLSALGWQWQGRLSKKFRSWQDTRQSPCLPGIPICHQTTSCLCLTGSQQRPQKQPLGQRRKQPPDHRPKQPLRSPQPPGTPTAIRTATSRERPSNKKGRNDRKLFVFLVPRGGLEPPRPCGLRILSPLRLSVNHLLSIT